MRVCPACAAPAPRGSSFCARCGTALGQSDAPPPVRRTITALFCDVVESTPLAEALDPETFRKLMSAFFEEAVTAVRRHGGDVENLAGDAVVARFGLPVAHEDDALRAVRAATEMNAMVARVNEEVWSHYDVTLETRIGINTGEVVVGGTSRNALAIGDAVHVAARLQAAASPGEVLIGEETYRLLKDAVEAIPRTVTLKGKSAPSSAYSVTAIVPGASGIARHLQRPLVGRNAELDLLEASFRRAVEGRSSELALIVGSPGIGKTRLLREAVGRFAPEAVLLEGACPPYGEAVTYRPMIQAITRAAGIVPEDAPGQQALKIADVVAADAHSDAITAGVCHLLGIREDVTTLDEIFFAIRRFLESLAAVRPVVLALEDLHWAEGSLVDLIEHIAEWSRGVPLLVIGSARRDFLDEHPHWSSKASIVSLRPLAPDESQQMMSNILGTPSGVDQIARTVSHAASGNPLFIEQMLSMLVDEGIITREGNSWRLQGVARVEAPPSIQALLAARLDALVPQEREVLEAAAVAGTEFSQAAVQQLLPPASAAELPEHLRSLDVKELIVPRASLSRSSPTFAFRHALIRDAAYRAIARERRVQLHEQLALFIQAMRGEDAPEPDEVVGHHYEQAHANLLALGPPDERAADLARRGAYHLEAAGRTAHDRHDMETAARTLKRAAALLAQLGPVPFHVLDLLVDATVFSFATEERQFALQELRRAAEAGDRRAEAECLLFESYVHLRSETAGLASAEDAVNNGLAAVRLYEQLDDNDGLARAWNYLSHFYEVAGAQDQALEAAQRVLVFARRTNNVLEEGWAREQIVSTMLHGGASAPDALVAAHEFLDWATGSTVRTFQETALHLLAVAEARVGHLDTAHDLLARAREMVQEIGGKDLQAQLAFRSYDIARCAGDLAGSEQDLRRAYEGARASQESGIAASLGPRLALVLLQQGRQDEGQEVLTEVEPFATEDDLDAHIHYLLASGRLAAITGDTRLGDSLIRQALTFLERTGWTFARADAYVTLADLLASSERPAEAADAAQSALELYEQWGEAPGASRARELIDRVRTQSSFG